MSSHFEQDDRMRSGDISVASGDALFAAKPRDASNKRQMGGGCVMTVLGQIEPGALGFCHAHEHLFNDNVFLKASYPDLFIDDFGRTVAELALFRAQGGCSIVDAQPVGCGRVAEKLVAASEKSGVHVIASTGFHKLMFYPENHWIHTLTEDEVLRLFLDEIHFGMFGSAQQYPPGGRVAAKPGVIKAAVDSEGITGRYEALFSAAAECSKQTGLPMLIHLEMGQRGGEVLDFLSKRGVPLSSVILCHLDRTLENPARIREAAEAGAFLEFDTIGRFKYHGDDEEAAMILDLLEAGFGRSILLGLDTTRSRMKSYGGAIGLSYIAEDFLPRLRKAGVPDEDIHRLIVENPARAFAIKRA